VKVWVLISTPSLGIRCPMPSADDVLASVDVRVFADRNDWLLAWDATKERLLSLGIPQRSIQIRGGAHDV
jgi:hypothetical protein